jgi:phage terminase large subunit-like protein
VPADRITTGSPAQRGEAAVKCHDDFDADDIVVEVNFGGEMATEVIKLAAERITGSTPRYGASRGCRK